MLAIFILGLFENIRSWVFMISLAASADEATMTGVKPSWWRFPIIGSPDGDGGKFFAVLEYDELHLERIKIIITNSDTKERIKV
nr:hypothetical protein [Tanacetum cinerariifolium]